MIISGEQDGPILKITVTFDHPDQVEPFHAGFMEMVKKYAEKASGIMVGINGDENDGIIDINSVSLSELSNKMGENN